MSWGIAGDAKTGMPFFEKAVDVLTDAVKDAPADTEARRRLANAYKNLGLALELAGRWMESERALGAGTALIESLSKDDPSSLALRRDLGNSWEVLGTARLHLGSIRAAEGTLGQARLRCQKLVRENPGVLDYLYILQGTDIELGRAHLAQGRTVLARRILKEGHDHLLKLLNLNPKYKDVNKNLIEYYFLLGSFEQESGDAKEALQWNEKAFAELTTRVGHDPNNVDTLRILFQTRVASLLLDLRTGQPTPPEKIDQVHQLVEELRRKAAKDPDDMAAASDAVSGYLALAERDLATGAPAEALVSLDNVSVILGPRLQASPELLVLRSLDVRSEARRSEALRRLGKKREAAEAAERAVINAEPLAREDSAYLFDLACARALQARLDPTSSALLMAVKALQAAVDQGFDNAYKLEHDDRLAPLRSRDDFRALVQRVKERVAKAGSREVANP
jgi:tetratricopeptide (TPR) repeat protein